MTDWPDRLEPGKVPDGVVHLTFAYKEQLEPIVELLDRHGIAVVRGPQFGHEEDVPWYFLTPKDGL